MGDFSCVGGELHPNSLTTSYSASSLDIKILLCANRTQSLLTESLTLDSFCSNAAGPLPAFPPSKIPGFSLVGLGDHLKLFSSTQVQLSEEPDKSTVLISTPTLPRLKCMLKECLSITKWAQNITGWHSPSHTPWMNVQSHATHEWIPEGSFFAPESFSLTLLKARFNKPSGKSSQMASIGNISNETYEAQSIHRDSKGIVEADVLRYKILESKNIRPSALLDLHDDIALDLKATSRKLSLPSLVVSNSYFTFPILFESTSTLAGGALGALASRRGQGGPPRLVEQSKEVLDRPYPEAATAFLGPSSMGQSSPQKEIVLNPEHKPALRFEDMIKNLRLQCSTLEPRIPAADSTWNSRSPVLVPCSPTMNRDGQKKDGPDHTDSRPPLHKPVHLGARSISVSRFVRTRPVPRPRESLLHRSHRLEKFTGTMTEGIQEVQRSKPQLLTRSSILSVAHSGYTEKHSTVRIPEEVSRQLRSAMAKASSTTTRHVFKKVRFAVMEHGPYEEPCPESHHNQQERAFDRPETDHSQEKGDRNNAINDTNQKPPLQRSASWAQKPPWKELRRTRSVSSTQPRSYSMVENSTNPLSISWGCKEFEVTDAGPRRGARPAHSTSSLGRHSLSRIIKGPMFSGRDGRRANIALRGHEVDENAVRRENQSPPEAHQKRKSRMPIPLRNILTRFK